MNGQEIFLNRDFELALWWAEWWPPTNVHIPIPRTCKYVCSITWQIGLCICGEYRPSNKEIILHYPGSPKADESLEQRSFSGWKQKRLAAQEAGKRGGRRRNLKKFHTWEGLNLLSLILKCRGHMQGLERSFWKLRATLGWQPAKEPGPQSSSARSWILLPAWTSSEGVYSQSLLITAQLANTSISTLWNREQRN